MNGIAKPMCRWISALALLFLGVVVGFFLRERIREVESPVFVAGSGNSSSSRADFNAPVTHAREVMSLEKKKSLMASPQKEPQWMTWIHEIHSGALEGELSKLGKLPETQIQSYLRAHLSDPDAWIAAAYLREGKLSFREAAERFPNDPAIQASLAMTGDDSAERRSAINQLRRVDPDNALGDYLSALDHLKQGRPHDALHDLNSSLSKVDVDDFSRPLAQAIEDAYLFAGFEEMDAKMAGMIIRPIPVISALMDLSKQMKNLQVHANSEVADSIRLAGLKLGRNLQKREYELLMDQLVGMSIERQFLDPSLDAIRLSEIAQEQDEIRRMTSDFPVLLKNAKPFVISGYVERLKTLGERQAMQWLEIQTASP